MKIYAAVDNEPQALAFDESEGGLYRFVNHPEQFYLHGPWLQGRYIRPRSPKAWKDSRYNEYSE